MDEPLVEKERSSAATASAVANTRPPRIRQPETETETREDKRTTVEIEVEWTRGGEHTRVFSTSDHLLMMVDYKDAFEGPFMKLKKVPKRGKIEEEFMSGNSSVMNTSWPFDPLRDYLPKKFFGPERPRILLPVEGYLNPEVVDARLITKDNTTMPRG